MAKFRQIQTNFWSNTYIQEEMTAEDKYFYLYLMTNEFTTQIGIYSITKKQMAFDLGYSIESVQALLQRFETYHKLIKYDIETREIILLKWAETNLNIGGKPVQDLIKKEISQVKNKEFLFLMFENCPENSLKNFIASLLSENKKNNNINTSYDTSDASFNDTGAINNKEEIINNNNNNINNLENIIEDQEQEEKVVVNSNGVLQQEIKMLLGVRKIKPYDIIKLNKPIERIKFVIEFCDKHNKADGYLYKALKDNWELKEVQQEEKPCYFTKPKEAYKELV
ncbi:hypothetical protein PSC67_11285 [Fusobacterium nucleatum]|nr:hypothetical protein [Fusobacterium nucleatum]WDF24593.1 hypothetical protein PSC67_11285 [Fusobacterium nucleatum]